MVGRWGCVPALVAVLACSGGEVDSGGIADSAFGGSGGPTTGPTTGASGLTSGADGSGDTGDPTVGDTGTGECVDADGDGYGNNCDAGPDCDDANAGAWSACDTCVDADGDGWYGECDAYPEGTQGPDCNDDNACVWTEAGCNNCVDLDEDGVWVGCDVYGDCAPGPDCHDGNASVGEGDAVELCNGVAENCAGEIDPYPADEMCPPAGVVTPGVTGWSCQPPAPGEDGCVIASCDTDLVDLDVDPSNGCECESLPAMDQGLDCANAIDLGDVNDGAQSVTITGNAVPLDRVVWYRFRGVDLSDAATSCDNYHVRVNFLSNPGDQYAFSVGRGTCDAVNVNVQCNDYSWATDLRVSDAGLLTGQCPCYAGAAEPPANVSACENDTAFYYVAVYRVAGAAPTCDAYQIAISNGVYDT